MKKNIVISTILYRPDDSTINRISLAAQMGYEVFIWDNTPDMKIHEKLKDNQKIRYFAYLENKGIGKSLRLMASTAYYGGYEYILYFDQDTIFTHKTLNYIDDFSTTWNLEDRLYSKFACITFRDFNRESNYRNVIQISDYTVSVVDFTISSGSLFKLENLKVSGWHDESYYIDGVDYAICLDIYKNGFFVGEIGPTPELDHSTEQADDNYSFFKYNFRARKYPTYRFIDYNRSSIKLIFHALSFSPRKSIWLIRSLIVFWVQQLLVVLSKKK